MKKTAQFFYSRSRKRSVSPEDDHLRATRVESSDYEGKVYEYFENVRLDALSLLPKDVDRVLEVGCGTGNTLAWLKANKGCSWVGGVEIFREAAEEARWKLDALYEGDVEALDLPIEAESLDAVLCLDVLEHMVDPWRVVRRLHALLRPGGVLIASIPNVRNFRVVLPLLLLGKWDYADSGPLDKTHLRFFVRKTTVELLECSGMTVDTVKVLGLEEWKARVANALTLSLFKPLFEYQYLMRARKGCPARQEKTS
jgi:2-polyprenyl-3-methyl-5-hydroxy-6-metoxy-1,4-benzoquinol methylase